MEERWTDIKGTDGKYRISTHGRIWSEYKSKRPSYGSPYINPYTDTGGYLQFEMSRKAYFVHRMVAEHFLEEPSEYLKEVAAGTKCGKVLVNHIDGNKQNNHIDNLEWTTHSANTKHAFERKLQLPTAGEKCIHAKLTETKVIDIRHKYTTALENIVNSLAEQYDVLPETIRDVLTGTTWRNIG